jgi:lysophospholipase L1-like esterase
MINGTVIILALFFLFIAAVVYLKYQKRLFLLQNAPRSGKNIIAFGDSLIAGHGASPGKDLVSLLSAEIHRPIINAGHGGDTTARALERLEKDVLERNPRLVIILLGGNDARYGVPPEETFRNLSCIIDKIRERGSAVLLLGIRGGIIFDRYRGHFHHLAKTKNIPFVPDIYKGIFIEPKLKSDFIHPNDEGYRLMAQKVAPVLKELVHTYFN